MVKRRLVIIKKWILSPLISKLNQHSNYNLENYLYLTVDYFLCYTIGDKVIKNVSYIFFS